MLREELESLVPGRDLNRRGGVLGAAATGFAAAVLPELSQARRLALKAGGRRTETGR